MNSSPGVQQTSEMESDEYATSDSESCESDSDESNVSLDSAYDANSQSISETRVSNSVETHSAEATKVAPGELSVVTLISDVEVADVDDVPLVNEPQISDNIEATTGEDKVEIKEPTDRSRQLDPTCYFDDGQRVIDFVLVYKESENDGVVKLENRRRFEEELISAGIDLEHESGFDDIHFLKLHANWHCLARQAELMQLLAPMQENSDLKHHRWWGSKLIKLMCKSDPFEMPNEYKSEEKVYYNSRFDQRRIEIFSCIDRDKLFSQTQRIRIVNMVLNNTSIGMATKGYNEVPICLEYLLRNGTYTDAYPLHDGDIQSLTDTDTPKSQLHYRLWLKEVWGCKSKIYQPIAQVRAYFGDKIAIYFALLGLLTKQLMAPAVVSVLCLVYGIVWAYSNNPLVDEICNSSHHFCRTCKRAECPLLQISHSCSRMAYVSVFDNWTLVVYSIFICLWGIFFLESWKRLQAEFLAFRDSTEQQDAIRFDYVAKATKMELNPDTCTMEPHHTTTAVASRWMTVFATWLFFVSLLTGFLFGMLWYRMVVTQFFRKNGLHGVSLVVYISGSLITILGIAVMEVIYRHLALWLTKLECPVTDKEFQYNFIRKFMMFQFVNYYGQLVYLGVLKGQFAGSPHTQPKYADRCSSIGCYVEANLHFILLVLAKQIIYVVKRWAIPTVKSMKKVRSNEKGPQWEKDFKLDCFPEVGISLYYEDLVIQYGFLLLFGSYFPIASVMVFLFFLLKIRLDANHLLSVYKRPVPESCDGIGIWMELLDMITGLATLSNALVIAISSQLIDRIMYSTRYSADGSLKGFFDFIWCEFDTADYEDLRLRYDSLNNATQTRFCQFKDYRYNYDTATKYDRETTWWVVVVARLAFILVFQHLIVILQNFVQHSVEDMSTTTKLHLDRRNLLEKRAYVFCEMGEKRQNVTADGKPLRRPSNVQQNRQREKEFLEEFGPVASRFNLKVGSKPNPVPDDNPYLRKLYRQRRKVPMIIRLIKWLNIYC